MLVKQILNMRIKNSAKKFNSLMNKKFCFIWNKLNSNEGVKNKKNAASKYDFVDMKFGSDARKMIKSGMIEMADTVGKTYGPLGKNVAISEGKNPIIVTKDGVTVAKYIKFSSRKKNLGCKFLSSVSGSTNEHAGDGTTTSAVLGAEIVKKGTQLIDIGFHPMDVKRGIEFGSKSLINYLESIRTFIKTKKEIYDLAMITTNNNEEISHIISKALIESGKKIVVNLEESQSGQHELKIDEGMFVNNGFASSDYIISEKDNSIYLDNPLILVVSKPIKEISQIVKTLEYIKSIERPLVIFSPDIKKEPLSVLLYNRRKENMDCIAVNIPDYLSDESNLEILNDICSMTGSKLCNIEDLKEGQLEKNLLFEDNFGSTKSCRISEFQTVLNGVKGNKQKIKNIIWELEHRLKSEKDPGYKNYYSDRLSRLQGKSVTIKIGGFTPVEIVENRDKFVDALNSCQSGVELGILPGGGSSLAHGLKIIEKIKMDNCDLNVGVNVFYHSIINTLKILFANSATFPDSIIHKIKEEENYLYGYNLLKSKFSDNLLEDGIIDSFNTVKTAIEDAVSVASLLITTECVVYKEIDYEPPPLDAFRNKIKTDEEFRDKIKKQFYDSPEVADDFKLFSTVI